MTSVGAFARRLRAALLALCGLLLAGGASARQPDPNVLRRGINVTHWFWHVPGGSFFGKPTYMSDREIDRLATEGFTFVRLPIELDQIQVADLRLDPAKVALLVDAVRRLQARNLGVFVVPMHDRLDLDHSAEDRAKLTEFWGQLAPALAPLPAKLTFPELVNEPVFQNPADWAALQDQLLGMIRKALPEDPVVLTGDRWSSIEGLVQLTSVTDGNVVYTFHFYEPPTLTSHASWDKSINGSMLKPLPFPVTDLSICLETGTSVRDPRVTSLIRGYCNERWDAGRIRARIDKAADWGRANNVVVVASEFGILADHEPESRLRYLAVVRSALEADGLGWALWGYDDGFGFNMPPAARPPDATPDPTVLRALNLAR
jgi:hypothetical protein